MKFGHIIIYVKDVVKTVEFYEKAFGVTKAFIDDTLSYAQLSTGNTALGFAKEELAQSNVGSFTSNNVNQTPAGFEISFETTTLVEDFQKALEAGCIEVAKPEKKPWGQETAYVRDLNGVLVELSTPMGG